MKLKNYIFLLAFLSLNTIAFSSAQERAVSTSSFEQSEWWHFLPNKAKISIHDRNNYFEVIVEKILEQEKEGDKLFGEYLCYKLKVVDKNDSDKILDQHIILWNSPHAGGFGWDGLGLSEIDRGKGSMKTILSSIIRYLKYCTVHYEKTVKEIKDRRNCGIAVVCDTLPSACVHKGLGFNFLKSKGSINYEEFLRQNGITEIKKNPICTTIEDIQNKHCELSFSDDGSSTEVSLSTVTRQYPESFLGSKRKTVFDGIKLHQSLLASLIETQSRFNNEYYEEVKAITNNFSRRIEETTETLRLFYFNGCSQGSASPNLSYVNVPAFYQHIPVWFPLFTGEVLPDFLGHYEVSLSFPEHASAVSIDILEECDLSKVMVEVSQIRYTH